MVTAAKAREAIQIELTQLREQPGEQPFTEHRLEQARTLFEEVSLPPDFLEFLTLPAYDLL
jgi:malate synthase